MNRDNEIIGILNGIQEQLADIVWQVKDAQTDIRTIKKQLRIMSEKEEELSAYEQGD